MARLIHVRLDGKRAMTRKKKPEIVSALLPVGFRDELNKPKRATYSAGFLHDASENKVFVDAFAAAHSSNRAAAQAKLLAGSADMFANEVNALKSIAESRTTTAEDLSANLNERIAALKKKKGRRCA